MEDSKWRDGAYMERQAEDKIRIKTLLYEHQRRLLMFHMSQNRTLDTSEMGVGKTLVAMFKAVMLYNRGLIDRVFVICPKSVMETWEKEVEKHSTFILARVEGSLEHKINMLNTSARVFIISYDSLSGRKSTVGKLLSVMLRKSRRSMVIADECTHVKSFSASRTKAVTRLCDATKYSMGLTGTPITNDTTSTITMYRTVDGGDTFGRNFFAARNIFFHNVGYGFPHWEMRPEREKDFHKVLYVNAVRLRKEECLSLPLKIFTNRYMDLNQEQLDLYVPIAADILKEMSTEFGKVKVKSPLVKISKLSQICGGFLYTDKDPIPLGSGKITAMMDIISEMPPGEKIVIFARWRYELELIARALGDYGLNTTLLHGGITDRKSVLSTFETRPDVNVLISQITAGSYGLNLAHASNIIYYSTGFSLNEWLQSQDRIHRIGQKRTCLYSILMCKNTIDEYIHFSLESGVDLSKALIDPVTADRLKENLLSVIERG
jgi:SNF2 family DNA or RNA helicase